MEMSIGNRFKKAYNAFMNRDPTPQYNTGMSYSYRPDRPRLTRGAERSIVTSIFNKIAIDASSLAINHCITDENGRYISTKNSGLNNCLTIEANLDQTGRALIMDAVLSMLDEGCVALVPTDTTLNPDETTGFDILKLRTGKILEWRPEHVKVRVYNERTGHKEDIVLAKRAVAIIENPLYTVVNEPNSNMQRLIRKLSLLDMIDEQTGSNKLDMVIQLPYLVKTDARRKMAEDRRKDLEMQLSSSKYGVAYIDGTEKITQLNRPLENNLLKQIEYLTDMTFSQIGISKDVMDGTANEQTMQNYMVQCIEPIVSAFVDEMNRKFLSKKARTQGQTLMFFRDPFRIVTATSLAELSDKLTRNEIMTSNEIRQKMGLPASDDPKADMLINSNVSQSSELTQYIDNVRKDKRIIEEPDEIIEEEEVQNG